MKKINQKELVGIILKEAQKIKRKKELFEEAKKINKELKQLNEYGHPGAMLGWGFKNSESPSPVIGLATQSPYEEVKPDSCDSCELDQFSGLEKEMGEINDLEENMMPSEADAIKALKDENEQLKARLSQIEDALKSK